MHLGRQLSQGNNRSSQTPAGALSDQPPEERLRLFQRDAAQVIRQLADGSLTLQAATDRLRRYGPLPARHARGEAMDFIARVVDEPRPRRKRLFNLLAALNAAGIFSPPRLLKEAVEAFAKDAFADPGDVDPPNLGDIFLHELLPSLGINPGDLHLPTCLLELMD